MKRMKTGGIVVTTLLLFSTVALLVQCRSESPLSFDSEIWKHQADGNKRLRMVGDLKPKLVGISKADVDRLLGAPRTDFDRIHPAYYYYLLGTQERFLDTDGIWLCVKFKNDRVNDFQIIHD